jgi:hypothetical protein
MTVIDGIMADHSDQAPEYMTDEQTNETSFSQSWSSGISEQGDWRYHLETSACLCMRNV